MDPMESLITALAAIEEARRASTVQSNEWLERYRKRSEEEHRYALQMGGPLDTCSEDEESDEDLQPADPKLANSKGLSHTSHSVALSVSREVFYEILSHLNVQDFLSLSRTCKPFRHILMSVSTKKLWQAAISRDETLPICPEDLSEPRYASLVFSTTCSECGVYVPSKVDVYLRVRLCCECQMELIECYPADGHVEKFVPTSERTYIAPGSFRVFALKLDVDSMLCEVEGIKASTSGVSLDSWVSTRKNGIRERNKASSFLALRMHAAELHCFLEDMFSEYMGSLRAIKSQRKRDIEKRLRQLGWTPKDMQFSRRSGNEKSWDRLVSRARPLTERAWTKLLPKLEVILKDNRGLHELQAWEERSTDRHNRMIGLLNGIARKLPPLAVVKILGPQIDYASTLTHYRTFGRYDGPLTETNAPFPSPAEALTLPTIKRLVETDTSSADTERNFAKLRKQIRKEIADWKLQATQDLLKIWHEQTPTEPTYYAVEPQIGNCPVNYELGLPQLVTTFTKPDGTSTSDIEHLSEDMRLLLRADVFFKTHRLYALRSYGYPKIIPTAEFGFQHYRSPDNHSLGSRWEPSTVLRDNDGSAAARILLGWCGRPNATHAEMRALGATFKCQKCKYHGPNTWEDLVDHYGTEFSRWKLAQEKLKEPGAPAIVYNNTHELESSRGPFFKFIPPKSNSNSPIVIRSGALTICMVCQKLDIRALYYCGSTSGDYPCEMMEHLAGAHEIKKPVVDEHFENPFKRYGDDEEDEDESDS